MARTLTDRYKALRTKATASAKRFGDFYTGKFQPSLRRGITKSLSTVTGISEENLIKKRPSIAEKYLGVSKKNADKARKYLGM